jgi:hypothetical protein
MAKKASFTVILPYKVYEILKKSGEDQGVSVSTIASRILEDQVSNIVKDKGAVEDFFKDVPTNLSSHTLNEVLLIMLEKGLTKGEMVFYLNSHNIATPHGKPWTVANIERYLKIHEFVNKAKR